MTQRVDYDYVLDIALKAEKERQRDKRNYRIVVMALAVSTVLNVGLILWRVM